MSVNSSKSVEEKTSSTTMHRSRHWWLLIALPAWVLGGFILASEILGAILTVLRSSGVQFDSINSTILQTTAAAIIYLLGTGIVIGVPWLVKKRQTTRKDLGLLRLPSWMDIGLAPAAFVIYLIASGIVTYLVTKFVTGFDASEQQQIGFENLTLQYEYVLAFLTLVIIAPIAEEVLFRGYLYGKLRKHAPLWVAVLITSVLFGLAHTQPTEGGGISGLNVAVDVFMLSIVMCGLREITGSIWAGILLHMLKNGLAFYLLFINTSLLSTIGG